MSDEIKDQGKEQKEYCKCSKPDRSSFGRSYIESDRGKHYDMTCKECGKQIDEKTLGK